MDVSLGSLMVDDTDARLVELARVGDVGAFESLVRRHLRVAYGAALAVTGDPTDAEDVCQDAFFQASRKLDDLDPPGKFLPWLLTIVRNRAHDIRRRRRVRMAESLDEGLQADGHAVDPGRSAERAELRERLVSAMANLSDVQREVLLLHDVEGWKHREIAELIGVAEGTVRAHLFHARRAMREMLGAEFSGG